ATASAPSLGHGLAAGEDDLVDVQEAVSLQADVDEGGLHSGQDIVDLALVDVADDRAAAAALDLEVRHLPLVARARLLAALPACRAALCLEHGDPGLRPVDADEDVLLHWLVPFCASREHNAAASPTRAERSAWMLVWVCSRRLSATLG